MKRGFISMLLAATFLCTSFLNTFTSNVKAVEDCAVTTQENLIINGNFDEGLDNWNLYNSLGGEGKATCEDGALSIDVQNGGDENYSVQASCSGFTLEKGSKYVLKFDISSSVDRLMYYCIQLNGGDYHSYVGDQIKLGTEKQTITKEFTMNDDTDLCPVLAFNLGQYKDEDVLGEHNVKIDNVQLIKVGEKEPVKEGENLIEDGTFDNGLNANWGTYMAEGGKGKLYCEDGKLNLDIESCGTLNYGVQVSCGGFELKQGGKYRLKFDISSSVDREMYYCLQLNGGDYHAYTGDQIKIGADTKTVTQEFTMTDPTDKVPKLVFNLGRYSEEDLDAHNIKIDNVELCLVDGSNIKDDDDEEKEQKIVLNQLGYLPDDTKKVVFRGENVDKEFKVVSIDTNEVVYTGEISEGKENELAGEIDYIGDLSSLTKEGTYKIVTENLGESYEFKIGKDVYKDALKDAVRFFYMQRCAELPEEYAGKWAHKECHTSLAKIYGTDETIDVSGGWHDAGDFGRYVVATSTTVADIIQAYNSNQEIFGDDTNIPESGNGIPDILDEVKGQIEWLFKMQNKDNGGVYHKVTCASFPGNIMPEEETGQLIVTPISTTATGDFAGVMAMAYDTFKYIDADLANKCLEAAEKAWDYLDDKPNTPVNNPDGIVTGAYEDSNDKDERYWAAAQLFKATGKEKYNEKIKEYVSENVESGYGWQSVGSYGNEAYLAAKNNDKDTVAKIKKAILKEADGIVKTSKADPYGTGDYYYWGGNMGILHDASLLSEANKISPNEDYVNFAKEHINYCFGKNANAKSFLTGYGTDAAANPHHRPSTVKKEAIPGMLVGGVNKKLEDDYAKVYLKGKAPAKCYLDNAESYSTNEVDIYWNAALVGALARLNMESVDTMDSNVDIKVDTTKESVVKQKYTISAKEGETVDLSKLSIRYYFNKEDINLMNLSCYHSGISLEKDPWYVNYTSDIAGTFGSDSKGDYVELKFNKAFELNSASEKVSIEMGLWNNDWSEMKDFEEKDMSIMYDGKLLK